MYKGIFRIIKLNLNLPNTLTLEGNAVSAECPRTCPWECLAAFFAHLGSLASTSPNPAGIPV
jgi:hypothetical protein